MALDARVPTTGLPHARGRRFALAMRRRSIPPQKTAQEPQATPTSWARERPPRVTFPMGDARHLFWARMQVR